MASSIPIEKAIAAMTIAVALGVKQGPELNEFMKGVDEAWDDMTYYEVAWSMTRVNLFHDQKWRRAGHVIVSMLKDF